MANSKKKKSDKKKSTYTSEITDVPVLKDPSGSIVGKIVIWLLIFGFAGLILIGSIYSIVTAF